MAGLEGKWVALPDGTVAAAATAPPVFLGSWVALPNGQVVAAKWDAGLKRAVPVPGGPAARKVGDRWVAMTASNADEDE